MKEESVSCLEITKERKLYWAYCKRLGLFGKIIIPKTKEEKIEWLEKKYPKVTWNYMDNEKAYLHYQRLKDEEGIREANEKCGELRDKLVRAYMDYIDYKKRLTKKNALEIIKYIDEYHKNSNVIGRLLEADEMSVFDHTGYEFQLPIDLYVPSKTGQLHFEMNVKELEDKVAKHRK